MCTEREGYVPVTGGQVWYRMVGTESEGVPLLLLHGGPGFSHDYLAPLAEMSEGRPVIFYDQLGSGRSDRPKDASLWTLPRFVEELGQVREALGLDRVHILGSSWGSMLATEYMLNEPLGVVSLVFAGPALSAPRWEEDVRGLLSGLSEESRRIILECEEAEDYDSEDYERAVMEFTQKHVCRVSPWPGYVTSSFESVNEDVYRQMWGPSEFTVTGTLRQFDRVDQLRRIRVPVLFICGRYDEATPSTTEYYHHNLPGSELHVVEDASHMQHVEQPDEFIGVVGDFLWRAEEGCGYRLR